MPIVLVGLFGQDLWADRFVGAVLGWTFPPLFGLTILTNDLLWWIPFTLILKDAGRRDGWLNQVAPMNDVVELLFCIHLGATFLYGWLIWFIQMVHYRLFLYVAAQNFKPTRKRHNKLGSRG